MESKDVKHIRILVLSAGGQVGTFLLRHFKTTPLAGYRYTLIAADATPYVACRKWCDSFYRLPLISAPEYEQALLAIIHAQSVDYIIPGTSYDVQFLSAWKPPFQDLKYICVAPDIFDLLHNKNNLYTWASGRGIPVPDIYRTREEIVLPAIAKRISGTGSKNLFILEAQADIETFFQENGFSTHLIQRYIAGNEYTIDCLFDLQGGLVGYHARKRIKTIGGGAVVSASAMDLQIFDILKQLEDLQVLQGPVNFQVLEDSSGKLYLSDFNPRFASGGLPLTVACGLDIPNKLLELLISGHTDPVDQAVLKPSTMVKYYDEYIY